MHARKVTIIHFIGRIQIKSSRNGFFFSDCSDSQLMYHKLSSKVMEKGYDKMQEILIESLPNCKSQKAWTNSEGNKFKACNNEIATSLGIDLENIENIVANNMNSSIPIEVQIGQLMEDVSPIDSNALDKAKNFFLDTLYTLQTNLACK